VEVTMVLKFLKLTRLASSHKAAATGGGYRLQGHFAASRERLDKAKGTTTLDQDRGELGQFLSWGSYVVPNDYSRPLVHVQVQRPLFSSSKFPSSSLRCTS
jgi:hypothetical protein